MLAHDFKVQSGPKQVDNDFGVVSFFPTLDHFSFRALYFSQIALELSFRARYI